MMRFEDLEAWKVSRSLTREVYCLTRVGSLAKDFGLCGQIQRAAVSAMSNIAEGFERSGTPEKLHFYNIAHASNGEVRSLTYVVEDRFPDLTERVSRLRELAESAGRLVAGLARSTQSRKKK